MGAHLIKVVPPFIFMNYITEIMAEVFSPDDLYLESGVFAKEQPLSIIGSPGVGKSLLVLQMAVCFVTGRPYLGWQVRKHEFPWLILQTENNGRRMQQTLNGYKKWLTQDEWKVVTEMIHIPSIADGYNSFLHLDKQGNMGLLRKIVVERQPGVIVLDPLSSFAAGNISTRTGMESTIGALAELANCGRDGCSLIILHHSLTGVEGVKKAHGFNRTAFARDSKLLVAWVRGQINIAPANDENNTQLAVFCGKNSNGPEFETFGIKLNTETMTYDVDPTFDCLAWKGLVAGEAPSAHRPNPKNVALLLKDIQLVKKDLVAWIMEEFGCGKSKAYEAILEAEGVTIKRNEHGLFVPM
jgi:hypothetical protein